MNTHSAGPAEQAHAKGCHICQGTYTPICSAYQPAPTPAPAYTPSALVDAMHDTVHTDLGVSRAARVVRSEPATALRCRECSGTTGTIWKVCAEWSLHRDHNDCITALQRERDLLRARVAEVEAAALTDAQCDEIAKSFYFSTGSCLVLLSQHHSNMRDGIRAAVSGRLYEWADTDETRASFNAASVDHNSLGQLVMDLQRELTTLRAERDALRATVERVRELFTYEPCIENDDGRVSIRFDFDGDGCWVNADDMREALNASDAGRVGG